MQFGKDIFLQASTQLVSGADLWPDGCKVNAEIVFAIQEDEETKNRSVRWFRWRSTTAV